MHSKNHIAGKEDQIGSRNIIFLIFILIFVTLIRIPTIIEPWGSDQGVYGYIADGLLKGKVPYKDMYTSTGYGLYFAYALFFKLFGNHMIALHMGDLLAALITVFLVFYITQMLYGKECAIIAALAAAIFGSGQSFSGLYDMKGAWGTYWQLAQRETFMTPLMAAGILIAVIADRAQKSYQYFWVGTLVGLAAVFKMTAVGMIVMLFLYLIYAELIDARGGGIKRCLSIIAFIILGFVCIQLPFIVYFWMNDSLGAMYKAVFVHTSIYAKLSRGNIIANAFQGNSYILCENLALWLFSFASIFYLMTHERKRENYLVVAWTIGTVLMIWGQGKFFGYHFILIVAPFSVLTGFGIKRFLKIKPSWRDSFLYARKDATQIFLWVLILGNLVVFAGNNFEYYRWHALYLLGKISKSEYYEVFNEYPLHLYSFRSDNEVADYIKNYAKPGASLRTVNGGGDTIIHYLTKLTSPTRFTSTWYLFSLSLYQDPTTDRLRQEFIDGIKSAKPDYILLIYYSMEEFRAIFNADNYHDTIELMDYISENYVLEKSFRDRRTLYKRVFYK
ncbi:glycosyltransferase family 39 protein [Thermodesulfobacteriota bacterium]